MIQVEKRTLLVVIKPVIFLDDGCRQKLIVPFDIFEIHLQSKTIGIRQFRCSFQVFNLSLFIEPKCTFFKWNWIRNG